tara:strand:+ start:140 stop:310 length:171 start_codon:yes stop_codon:yes gene_type:complete
MKRRELYKVTVKGKELLSDLSESEYFRFMEDLSIEYYQTGTPHPDDIITETYLEED